MKICYEMLHRTSVEKPQGNIPLGTFRHSWEDNININRKDIECGLASYGCQQGPVAGSCKHDNEFLGFIKGLVIF
jgi:hypothetical protein